MNSKDYALKVKALTDEFLGSQNKIEEELDRRQSNGWDNLVAIYAKDSRPLSVRIASLAQWILESNRGVSKLALDHLNYGGIKYRSELSEVATPVNYDAHDGADSYAHFNSDSAFIAGYWKFIARAPYKGWEEHTFTAMEYLGFIAGKGYATDPNYVMKVSRLFPEAERLLTGKVSEPETPKPEVPVKGNGKVIVLDPGHGGKDPGAVGLGKTQEDDVALAVCMAAKDYLERKGFKVYLTRAKDESLELSFRTAYANKVGADAFVSVHCNAASNRTATGTECLYRTGHASSMALASSVLKETLRVTGGKSRGLKASPSAGYSRSIYVVRNHPASRPATLVELEFISAPAMEQMLKDPVSQEMLGRAISNGVENYFEGSASASLAKLALNALMPVSPA